MRLEILPRGRLHHKIFRPVSWTVIGIIVNTLYYSNGCASYHAEKV